MIVAKHKIKSKIEQTLVIRSHNPSNIGEYARRWKIGSDACNRAQKGDFKRVRRRRCRQYHHAAAALCSTRRMVGFCRSISQVMRAHNSPYIFALVASVYNVRSPFG